MSSSPRAVSASIWRVVSSRLAILFQLAALALLLRLGDLAGLGEDLLGLAARLRHRRAVLFDELVRLGPGLVGLVERGPDPLSPLVDHLLDPAEREPLQHVERDEEAHDGPDHQARRDLDQRVGGENRGH